VSVEPDSDFWYRMRGVPGVLVASASAAPAAAAAVESDDRARVVEVEEEEEDDQEEADEAIVVEAISRECATGKSVEDGGGISLSKSKSPAPKTSAATADGSSTVGVDGEFGRCATSGTTGMGVAMCSQPAVSMSGGDLERNRLNA